MPNCYRATINTQAEYQLEVFGADTGEAERNARGLGLRQFDPVCETITEVRLELAAARASLEGCRVEHHQFGRGVITRLERISDGAGSCGHLACIRFDSGDERGLLLPQPPSSLRFLEN
jgi:hypothetical protein